MNMKTLLLAGTFMLTAIAFTSNAQATDATGQASAFIQNPIVITEAEAMDFATINADPDGDTITLDTNGDLDASNASTFAGNAVPGEFDVTGTPNGAVAISFVDGTLSGPGDDMDLTAFTHNAGNSPSFDNNGDLNFNVGADLDINNGQVGGQYSGTYTLTVEYQ